MPRGQKLWKLLFAVLLLPVCAGGGVALFKTIHAVGAADTAWVPLMAGAASWLAVYMLLPKPMWVYVFGHEFTHAIWAWLFGGSVQGMKVSADGGHVYVTKDNFLITLAPYFFPLYALSVAGVYVLGNRLWGWSGAVPLGAFHTLLGVAYAFHITLTWRILQVHQPDIASQGKLFSIVKNRLAICLPDCSAGDKFVNQFIDGLPTIVGLQFMNHVIVLNYFVERHVRQALFR